ncbi:hypothetical protein ADL26_13925, partial [Thermoactinomyces vulgaris]
MGAFLAVATVLAESEFEVDLSLARLALDEALASSAACEGERGAAAILRLLTIGLKSARWGLPASPVASRGLIRVAGGLREADPARWSGLPGALMECIAAVDDPARRDELCADAGLQLSQVDFGAARG